MDQPVVTLNLDNSAPLWADVYAHIAREGLIHVSVDTWPCEDTLLPDDPKLLMLATSKTGHSTMYAVKGERPSGVAVVTLSEGTCSAHAYSVSPTAADDLVEWIRELQPRAIVDDEKIEVRYWFYTPDGARSNVRQIDAPAWDDVQENYTEDVRAQLQGMVENFDPGVGGQLLLWTGPPGTGKTSALRTIAREWSDWCRIHYVIDPDKFFGSQADYLIRVLLGESETPKSGDLPQWRLIVLEDSGELLRKDAGEITGKALGRLLNTVDGLIGQGLRIMVLVTTNEPIGELHEAIARPGRCAIEIPFQCLEIQEADMWRERYGLPPDDAKSNPSLADLYAELKGFKGARSKQPVGF